MSLIFIKGKQGIDEYHCEPHRDNDFQQQEISPADMPVKTRQVS